MDKAIAFVTGMARTMDLFGVLDPPQPPPRTDAEALERDWRVIGRDLAIAAERVIGTEPLEQEAP